MAHPRIATYASNSLPLPEDLNSPPPMRTAAQEGSTPNPRLQLTEPSQEGRLSGLGRLPAPRGKKFGGLSDSR